MRTWAKSGRAVLLTASFVALGAGIVPGAAMADTTDGDNSVLGGNQVQAPISLPIDISGNALAVFGTATATSHGGTKVVNKGGGGGNETSGKGSIGGGNQVTAPISAPINACGNAVAIFGTADAGCKGGATVVNKGGGSGNQTSGEHSVLGGNQVTAPISAPVNACGNAVAVFGSSEAGCKGGATVVNKGGTNGSTTNGDGSVLGGNQVYAPISAPVNVCGNSAAILGDAVAGCKGGAKVVNQGGNGGLETSGKHSVLGGNQVEAPVSIPVNVCGNAAGNASAGCEGGAETENNGQMDPSGDGSIGGGNQVFAPVSVPVNACGNAVGVLGDAAAMCHGGAKSSTYIPGGMHTSGKHSVLGGNQVYAPINAPVNVCGNAVAVAGEAAAGCKGGSSASGSRAPHIETSGDNGVGGGNQVVAPVKAPVEVCGNNVGVAGDALPQCGVPMKTKHSRLPVVPGLDGALPVLGGAMPALPTGDLTKALPLGDITKMLPVSSLPVSSLPLRKQADPVSDLTGMLPLGSLPLTDVTGMLPVDGLLQGLPVGNVTGGLPARAPRQDDAVSGLLGGLLAGVPTGSLTGLGSVTGSMPVSRQPLPTLPGLPVTGDLKLPETGGTLDQLQDVTQLTDAVPMASVEEAPAAQTGSLWVLLAGAVMAAASATGAFTRRLVRKG